MCVFPQLPPPSTPSTYIVSNVHMIYYCTYGPVDDDGPTNKGDLPGVKSKLDLTLFGVGVPSGTMAQFPLS